MEKFYYDSMKEFSQSFFKELGEEVFWYEEKGIYRLNDTLLVEFSLERKENYGMHAITGYRVRIIYKKAGEVAKQSFYFKTYLNDVRYWGLYDYFLYNPRGWLKEVEWMPKDTKEKPSEEKLEEMAQKIVEYINHFK